MVLAKVRKPISYLEGSQMTPIPPPPPRVEFHQNKNTLIRRDTYNLTSYNVHTSELHSVTSNSVYNDIIER